MPGPGAGAGVGGLAGRNAGLGRAGQGSSTCYLLGFCSGAVLLSHIFPTAEAQTEQPGMVVVVVLVCGGGGGGVGGHWLQRRGQRLAHHLPATLFPCTPSLMRKEMPASTFLSG